MSLLFASGQYVDHGSGASLDDLAVSGSFSVGGWVYRTVDGSGQIIISKDGNFPSGWHFGLWNIGAYGVPRLLVWRGGATTNTEYRAAASVWAPLNTWTFVAATFDDATSPEVHIYVGSLGALCTEVTYQMQSDGSGTPDTDATSFLYVGNRESDTTSFFAGRIQRGFVANTAKTLAELQDIQRLTPPQVGLLSGVKLSFDYRLTGTQADYSGNGNTGAITGASLAVGPFNPLGVPRHNPAQLLTR